MQLKIEISPLEKYSGNRDKLYEIYNILFQEYGKQYWWPGDTPLEVSIGAILTQNTSWTNVEKAIRNIKANDLMDSKKLLSLPDNEMAGLIKPAGYFNVKTKRLKNFLSFIVNNFDGKIENFFNGKEWENVRNILLKINGIGPETADSILLYAGNYPVFVVDKYTQRIFSRHNMVAEDVKYEVLQSFFMNNLDNDEKLFNEYHALIVRVGKDICRPKPKCDICPLNKLKKSA